MKISFFLSSKKIVFYVLFSILIFTAHTSIAQVTYKTLLGIVWSSSCNDPSAQATMFIEDGNVLKKQFYGNGQSASWVISNVESVGANNLSISYTTNNNKSGNELIEFNNQSYKVLERIIDGRQYIKSGKNLQTNTDVSNINQCPNNSPVYSAVMNANALQKNNEQSKPNFTINEDKNYHLEFVCVDVAGPGPGELVARNLIKTLSTTNPKYLPRLMASPAISRYCSLVQGDQFVSGKSFNSKNLFPQFISEGKSYYLYKPNKNETYGIID